jgi:hypothetical protein
LNFTDPLEPGMNATSISFVGFDILYDNVPNVTLALNGKILYLHYLGHMYELTEMRGLTSFPSDNIFHYVCYDYSLSGNSNAYMNCSKSGIPFAGKILPYFLMQPRR